MKTVSLARLAPRSRRTFVLAASMRAAILTNNFPRVGPISPESDVARLQLCRADHGFLRRSGGRTGHAQSSNRVHARGLERGRCPAGQRHGTVTPIDRTA